MAAQQQVLYRKLAPIYGIQYNAYTKDAFDEGNFKLAISLCVKSLKKQDHPVIRVIEKKNLMIGFKIACIR